ncbi:RAMP superfamily CRISPR-associated protein [Leptolyngbya sp. AN03gr2]|uniref:RAMP superfamily CRISPR-associated protein n=1 Tax=unclassified Leptolyngbya TaxID=2650499 RepID=UPI003D31F5A9
MVQLQSLQNSVESFRLKAVIDTALCVGAGGSTGSLADKPIIRNAQNQLVIPASQLKGRLRHECEKLARALRWAVCESPNPKTMCSRHINLLGRFDHDEYQARVNDSHHCLICQIFGNPSLPSKA